MKRFKCFDVKRFAWSSIQCVRSLLSVAFVFTPAFHVEAIEFDLRFIGKSANNISLQNGMRAAADEWSRHLTDPVRVVVDVQIKPVVELGFAQALTFRVPEVVSYDNVRPTLVSDASSIDDHVSIAHLPEQGDLTFRANEPDGSLFINQENEGINGHLDVPRANAKALSLPVSGDENDADAEIQWNEFFLANDFDFDRSDGISGSDFVAAAIHELGHVLGFLSGVDDFDESSLPAGPFAPTDLRGFAVLNVPDLFRYSAESLPHLDLAFGGKPYFSIDGSETPLGRFGTGYFNGDGIQAGHWQNGHGIMDGELPGSEIAQISPLDLRMMDVIGWDVAPVPEPSTTSLLVFGLLFWHDGIVARNPTFKRFLVMQSALTH